MNGYVYANELVRSLGGFTFDPNVCPINTNTPAINRRLCVPWLSDGIEKPKDFIWDSGGWECDCFHSKVLSAPMLPYSDTGVRPGEYIEPNKRYPRWLCFSFEFSDEKVVMTSAEGYRNNGTFWYSGSYQRAVLMPDSTNNVVCYYYNYKTNQTFPTAAAALAAVNPDAFVLRSVSRPRVYYTDEKLLYVAKASSTATLYGEDVVMDGEQKTYRMTAHALKAKSNFSFLSDPDVSSACAMAYYDALKGTKAKLCDNTIQNIVMLMAFGAAIGTCISYAKSQGIKRFNKALSTEIGNAIADLTGFTTPGATIMINKGGSLATSWYRKAAYKVAKSQKAAAAKAIRSAATAAATGWLGYHYAYCTTVQDAYDALRYIDRQIHKQLVGLDRTLKSYGTCKFSNKFGKLVTVRCRICYRNKDIPEAIAYWDAAWQQGIELNPYVLWDSIPLSFIADWFLPIGDYAEVLSDLPHLTMFIDMLNVCYSMEYDYEKDNVLYNLYTRWHNNEVYPVDDIVAGMQLHDGSVATAFRRINDTISLAIGG